MAEWRRADTSWMRGARWGVMFHYLADQPGTRAGVDLDADEWNRRVDMFDVDTLVRLLVESRAGYVLFTLGQNSGFYCSPNETFDALVGRNPSRLSRRDLIGELAAALAPTGIRLLAYLPSHAPTNDPVAVQGLGFTPEWDPSRWGLEPGSYERSGSVDERLSGAQRNWEAVISEWSRRWGSSVSGWWIDGCYYADRMYRHDDGPGFRTFAQAMKSGNPDAVVAFNGGVARWITSMTPYEDYTAGEANQLPVSFRNHRLQADMDGARLHILSYLGDFWCSGPPRFSDELARSYTKYIASLGGCLTWDVPIDADGTIDGACGRQMVAIGTSLNAAG